VLFDMTTFTGGKRGAVGGYQVAIRHFSDIEKLAIVVEIGAASMATFCKPFTKATVQYFDHADDAAALTWLSEA